MSEPKPNSRKENVFEMIVNALEGKSIENDEPIVETYQNQWLIEIAKAITKVIPSQGMQIHYIESVDKTNPVQLRNLDSGVYVLYGYFNPCEAVTKTLMAQTPIYASIGKSSSKSYIQLFFPLNNTIQYFEITDADYTVENTSLKTSNLKTDNKTIIGAINELYDKINGTTV